MAGGAALCEEHRPAIPVAERDDCVAFCRKAFLCYTGGEQYRASWWKLWRFLLRHIRLVLGLAVGALFVWLLVRRLDFEALWRSLQGMRYPLLIPSLALALLGFVARAYRWGFLFVAGERIPFKKLYTATMIGFMGNALLPARAGEFIRAYVLSRSHGNLAASKAFATIVGERILDGIALTLLLCLVLIVLPAGEPVVIPEGTFFEQSVTITEGWFLSIAAGALGIFAGAAAVVALIYLKGEVVARVLGETVSRFSQRAGQRVTHLVTAFASGFDVVRDKRRLATAAILSVLVFPDEVHWPWYTSIVVLAVVCVGIMIPASPGFVGTFHAFCVVALMLCARIDFDSAVAFSVIYHGATMVVLVAVGLICLWVENLSFVEVARRAGSGPGSAGAGQASRDA